MSKSTPRTSHARAQPHPRRKTASLTSDAARPRNSQNEYDFDRLETVVTGLVDAHRRLLEQNVVLRSELGERNQIIRELEGRILESNQKRQDVTKCIDELIAQIDQLDAHLAQSDDK